jgi:hypothetical protein
LIRRKSIDAIKPRVVNNCPIRVRLYAWRHLKRQIIAFRIAKSVRIANAFQPALSAIDDIVTNVGNRLITERRRAGIEVQKFKILRGRSSQVKNLPLAGGDDRGTEGLNMPSRS